MDNASDDRSDKKPRVADRTDASRSDRVPPKRDTGHSRGPDGGSRHRSERRRSRSSERRSSRSSRDEDDRRRRRRTPPRRHSDKRSDREPARDIDDFGRDPKQRKYTKGREDENAKKTSPAEKLLQADRAGNGSRDKPYPREGRRTPEKKMPHSIRPCEKRDSVDDAKKPVSNSGIRSERDTNQKTDVRSKSYEVKPDSERCQARDKKPLLATPKIEDGRGLPAKKFEDAPQPLMKDLPHVSMLCISHI